MFSNVQFPHPAVAVIKSAVFVHIGTRERINLIAHAPYYSNDDCVRP